jgi:AraC family transcriptional regulator
MVMNNCQTHRATSDIDPAGPSVQSIAAGNIVITRTRSDRFDLEKAPVIASAVAFSVIVQMQDFQSHRLWRQGRLVYDGGHDRGALAITDLRENWQCHHLSPFDNVRFQIPFSCLRAFAEDVGRIDYDGLRCAQGLSDPVMLGLASALLPSLQDPAQANPLFVEQIRLAALAHLTQTYGGLHFPATKKGTLALWQEKRATEFLAAHFDKAFAMVELASACELSRSYFIKAFKESFGRTPQRWLTEYRISQVKQLLQREQPIAEIAIACGFADQSHMTRVFSEVAGETPGSYRRRTMPPPASVA